MREILDKFLNDQQWILNYKNEAMLIETLIKLCLNYHFLKGVLEEN
jgi:hypothetical protein